MNAAPKNKSLKVLAGLAVCLAAAAAAFVLARADFFGAAGPGLGKEFLLDLSELEKIDPALLRWREEGSFATRLAKPIALAVGPGDRIYVAGEGIVRVFSALGEHVSDIHPSGPPRCLTVADDGCVFVGLAGQVEAFDSQGRRAGRFPDPGDGALLTALAVRDGDLFAADSGSRQVLHYDRSGRLLGPLGRDVKGQEDARFIVPSPYFDLAFAPDGLLRVVNPGLRRIEAYTIDGHREFHWGSELRGVAGFVGCCNPVHLAVLGDGRIVTSEKGIARVKVYGPDVGPGRGGVLESVVGGPETFTAPGGAMDVAADSAGRVLVLEGETGRVRVFVPAPQQGGALEAKP